jgi:hypothetical protein
MALTTTLLALRTAARQRADQVNSGFVSDTELNSYINASLCELYDLIISTYGEDYYVTTATTALTSSTDTYALPSDFYKCVGVDLVIANNTAITLERFNFVERNQYRYTIGGFFNQITSKYKIIGNNIKFLPFPAGGVSVKIWYIPVPTLLVGDSDTFDGVSGWEEYIITDAAIKMMQKEESDVSVLAAQKMALVKRIQDMAPNRDAGSAPRIGDVYYTVDKNRDLY